jgi:hypothetical protein
MGQEAEATYLLVQPAADHGGGLVLTDMHPDGTVTLTDTCFVNHANQNGQGMDMDNS